MYNVGGFEIGGGVVTIPQSGKYTVSGVVSGSSNGTSGYVQIRTVGGAIYESVLNRPSASRYTSVSIPATICEFNAGDRVGLYNLDNTYLQDAGIDQGYMATQMNIVRIG